MNHMKTDRLYLHVPEFSELDYRRKLMADPGTMSYNKGYDLNFSGYDPDTGCIAFPQEEWAQWYEWWTGHEPERFYAYVMRRKDNMPVGEVCLHHHGNDPFHEMGIVIEAYHRGRGYGLAALKLLMSHAFDDMHVKELHNSFEESRRAAMAIHQRCGFAICGSDRGITQMACTKEGYLSSRVKMMERKELSTEDIPEVLELYRTNPQYFVHCPPEPDEDSVSGDMTVKPEGIGIIKHFYGWYEDGRLCALMDLLENYPETGKAWIGLFMVHSEFQHKGMGRILIKLMCEGLSKDKDEIRLGVMETNTPAFHFWQACGFEKYGSREGIILMRKTLNKEKDR